MTSSPTSGSEQGGRRHPDGAGRAVPGRAGAPAGPRDNEERLRLAMEVGGLGSWDWDLASGAVAWSDEHFRLLGYAPGEVEPSFGAFAARVHPDDLAGTVAMLEATRAEMRDYAHRFRAVMPDGRVRWISARGRHFADGAGRPARLIGVIQDITEAVTAEAALRESEERFRQFGAASSDVLWIRGAKSLDWEYLSPAYETVHGHGRDAAMTGDTLASWIELVHPDDRERVLCELGRVADGERVTFEYRVRRPSDGAVRWLRNSDFPLRGVDGTVERVGGIARDVTESKQAADRLAVLVAELQHRTRNIVAVVQALADRTAMESGTLPAFRTRFRARLGALARAQGLLSRLEDQARVDFGELLRTELAALGVFEAPAGKVTLDGPAGVRLRSGSVQTLALALHELAAEAERHGALAAPGGRLAVRWRVERDDGGARQLRVEWRETGVDRADPRGTGAGFGRALIERALPHQLGAETRFRFESDGVRCTILLPLQDIERETANA